MQTADWALVISLCSFAVALASFVWNVWSKFIYPKPKVRVRFAMKTILYPLGSGQEDFEVLDLSATNMGPIEAALQRAFVLHRPYWFSPTRRNSQCIAEHPAER